MQSLLTHDKITLKYIDTGADHDSEDARKPWIILVCIKFLSLLLLSICTMLGQFHTNHRPSGLIDVTIWPISQKEVAGQFPVLNW